MKIFTFIILAICVALIVFTGDEMNNCLEHHSHDVCFSAMNR